MASNNNQMDDERLETTQMQKDMILSLLREKGCRITKQRLVLIDIILTGNYSCSKEIYYAASKVDKNIGAATVYRMINTLEEIGAINRKNMYKVSCCEDCSVGAENCSYKIPMVSNNERRLMPNTCEITLIDGTKINLNAGEWYRVVRNGLNSIGYEGKDIITNINIIPYNGGK